MGIAAFRGAAFVLASVACAHLAHAESLEATRYDAIEKEHRVQITMERGKARLIVRRTVQNTGPKSDQAIWHITPPEGGVAVGLRTSGVKPNGEAIWFEGELMEAEAAAAKYQELTGIGGYYPKDPALLSWRSASDLALQVFPVPARGDKTVEYNLVAPTTYDEGEHVLVLPAMTDAAKTLPATYVVAPGDGANDVLVNGVPVTSAVRIKQSSREIRIALRPKRHAAIEGNLGAVTLGGGRAMSHVRVYAAPRLSQVPANAAVAIVVDTSRSMEGKRANAFAAARSYVSQFPNAAVDVLTFDRKVQRRTKTPVSPSSALALLADTYAAGNGSHVDDAIAAADELLAQRAASERRILVLTDLRARDAVSPTKLAMRTWKSHAVVHVATVDDGSPSLTRDDDDPWSPVAANTGGVLWRANHPTDVDVSSREVIEEWARPKRIDHAELVGTTTQSAFPTSMPEGTGFEDWSVVPTATAAFTVRGKLWSRPFSSRIDANAQDAKTSSALVFGSALLGELSEPEMMTLAMKGRAVSPVTSYLAIEPGVRPSTEGLDWSAAGTGSGAGFGSGSGRMAGRHVTPVDKSGFLARALADAAKTCGARGEVNAKIETTLVEIVDVVGVTQGVRDAKIESCIAEALWSVTLPGGFTDEHERYDVTAKL